MGGDEFLVVCTSPESVGDLADRLIRRVNEPVGAEGGTEQIGMSVGVGVAPVSTPLDDLVRRSDTALRSAKARGRNQYVAHDG